MYSTSKEPIPAFAFLQVKEQDLQDLSLAVQNAVWEDAKGTFNSPTLIGPPYVELSIYKKIPVGKPKKDPKEGTIDEDDEWKTWQFSLTEDPALKKGEEDNNAEESAAVEPNAKRPVTALVAHILENKANKAKEAANAKSRKHARQDSQGKGKGSAASEEPKKRSKDKADKPKETVRILKKQAATEAAAEAAKAVAKEIKAGASTSERATGRRQLGLKDILKRDLGIKDTDSEAKPKRTKGQENGSSAAAASGSTQASEQATTPTAPKAQAEKSSRRDRRRGKDSKANESKTSGSSEAPAPPPVKPTAILQKKKDDAPAPSSAKDATPATKSANKAAASTTAPVPPTGPKAEKLKGSQAGSSQKKGNNSASPSQGATRAFLKHANPSQGVTESLLKEAMGAFGGVSSVEIDRRKGFAYVEFTDHDGLVKAMAASPVTISNASVQVLERKEQTPKKAATASNNTSATAATAGAAKEGNTAVGPSSAAAAAPAAPAEKANGEQSQPKRNRRRGRGKGGNGAAGKEEGKTGEQGGPAASGPATGEASGAG